MSDRPRHAPLIERRLGAANQLVRLLWNLVWLCLYRPTPRAFHVWRCWLLRLFGAKLGKAVHPYPSARIWAPWNLEMGDHACLSEYVDCYCVDRIRIGAHAIVSQYSFLCTASHDYERTALPLVTAPIAIGERAWVTADVFVAPGVSIGAGTVVLARSTVLTDLPPWTVSAGNPARVLRSRELRDAQALEVGHG